MIQGYPLGTLTTGTHTLSLDIDSGQVIAESNEADNSLSQTITITLAADDVTRPASLTVLTNGNGSVTPNYAGQPLQLGRPYTISARPNPGSIFVGWTGGANTNSPSLRFTAGPNMLLQANFAPNPFTPLAGSFNGLVYDTNAVAQPSAGAFTVTLTAMGGYSGSLQMGGVRYSLSGQFNSNGRATALCTHSGSPPLTVTLQLDTTGGSETISGGVAGNGWTALIEGDRAVFALGANPTPLAGAYTMVLAGNYGASNLPGGDSCGTLTVSAGGRISFSGSLADGYQDYSDLDPIQKRAMALLRPSLRQRRTDTGLVDLQYGRACRQSGRQSGMDQTLPAGGRLLPRRASRTWRTFPVPSMCHPSTSRPPTWCSMAALHQGV